MNAMLLGSVFDAIVAGRADYCFLPLEACVAPSGTMKAIPQGGGFQVSSSALCLTCMMSPAIDRETSEGTPRAIAIFY